MVVRLQFAGSCKSCPSSAVTLEFAVEDAVRAAAPEITSIEVVAAEAGTDVPTVIPADSLMSRVHHNERGAVALASGSRRRGSRGRRGRRVPGRGRADPGVPGRRRPVRLPRPVRSLRRLDGGRRVAPPDGRGRRRGRPALPALPRTFRRRARRCGPRRRPRTRLASRPDPAAGSRRRAVGRGRAEATGVDGMAGAYDVLARIRATKRPAAGR